MNKQDEMKIFVWQW